MNHAQNLRKNVIQRDYIKEHLNVQFQSLKSNALFHKIWSKSRPNFRSDKIFTLTISIHDDADVVTLIFISPKLRSSAMKKIYGGYYIKARQVQTSKIFNAAPCVREVWDYLLMMANYTDTKVCARGQHITTSRTIQEALDWYAGPRREMYKITQIQNAIKYLKREKMIKTSNLGRATLITIENYSYYQDPRSYENHSSEASSETQNECHVNAKVGASECQYECHDECQSHESASIGYHTGLRDVNNNECHDECQYECLVNAKVSPNECHTINKKEERKIKKEKKERESARARDPSFQNQSNVTPIRKMAEGSNSDCAEGNVFKNNMQISDAQLAQVWNENFPEKPYRGFSFSGHQRDDFMESTGHLNTREKWQEIFDLCKKSKLNGKDPAFPATWFTLTWIIKLKNINDLLSGKYDYFNEQKSLERIKREMRENSTYEGDYEYDWSESNEFI